MPCCALNAYCLKCIKYNLFLRLNSSRICARCGAELRSWPVFPTTVLTGRSLRGDLCAHDRGPHKVRTLYAVIGWQTHRHTSRDGSRYSTDRQTDKITCFSIVSSIAEYCVAVAVVKGKYKTFIEINWRKSYELKVFTTIFKD